MERLRIYRTFTWELDVSLSQARIGGENPMKLVAHDTLQFLERDAQGRQTWANVTIEEEEKPPHPHLKKQQDLATAIAQHLVGIIPERE